MAVIYMIRNKKTGKVYIGRTIRDLGTRWLEHLSAARKSDTKYKFHRAIRRHGPDCWELSVIEQVPDQFAAQRELYWVSHYKSFSEGYNSTLGGTGGMMIDSLTTWTCEECGTEKEVRNTYKNTENRFCGKSCAAKHTNKLRWDDAEYKSKTGNAISEAKKAKTKNIGYNGAVYTSLKEAAEATNVPLSTLYWKAKRNKDGWSLL